MQNINLYQPERAASQGLRPLRLLLGLAALLVALMLHGAWTGWRFSDAERAAALAEQQALAAEAELTRVSGLPMPQADPKLPDALARQTALNSQLQRLVGYLATLEGQRAGGFVPLLAGLAERHPPQGLWLTRIRLADGGEHLGLQGLTEHQDVLPAYLKSLGMSAAFTGRTFGQLDIEREPGGLLRFRLASEAGQESEDE